jgi:hypothetical protein
LDNSGTWLKLDDTAVRILLLIPPKMCWQITKVGKNKTHLLMLGLRIDVFLDSGIDSAKVHASSVQGDHWSLDFGVNLEELRVTVFHEDFEELFDFLGTHGSH